MATITIRRAAKADAERVYQLLRDLATALGKSGVIKSTPADIEHYGFGDSPHFEALLAFEGDDDIA